MKLGRGEFLQGDCMELMRDIPDGSVDMILCDLPYGTTACSWDSVIPFEPLWEQYWRICKPNAAVVLTSAQPFTTALIGSQIKRFRYTWYWNKTAVTGFANAKKMPLRCVEDVCVFYKSLPTYNPQGLVWLGEVKTNGKSVGGDTVRGDTKASAGKGNLRTEGAEYVQEWTNYPRQVLGFQRDSSKQHPTQKPVALFEYLIRTYTNEGEHVLDNTAGSGTTAIAAENAGRRWTCMERDPTYYEAAIARVWDHLLTPAPNEPMLPTKEYIPL